MKILLTAAASLLFLNSCVFESPFEADAKFPVDPGLLGRWEEIQETPGTDQNRMLVLQNTPNDYVVEYPVGEKAMFFRAYAVELSGAKYMQIQLIGSHDDGDFKPEDRKYHLLKVLATADGLEMSTINPDVLGKDLGDPARMKTAFAAHKDDPGLFEKPGKFRRIK
ncbi:MAG: hypothetical protein ABIT37_25220 [Luteolibacter sp.]